MPDTIGMIYTGLHPEQLDNWHAPIITFAYSFFGRLAGYPAGALLLQSALLMLWPASVLARLLQPSTSRWPSELALVGWLLVLVAFVVLAGQVVKDVLLLSLGSALLFAFEQRAVTRAGGTVLVAILVLGICLIRPPNVAVVVVCAVLASIALAGSIRRVAIRVVATIVLLIVGIVATDKLLLPAKDAPSELALVVFDLAGISAIENIDLFAEFAGKKLSNTPPSVCYTPKRSNPFIWGECKEYWEKLQTYPVEALTKFWIGSILQHPIAYARHRLRYTLELLKNDDPNDFIVTVPPFTLVTNTDRHIESMSEAYRQDIQMWEPTIAFLPFGNIAQFFFSRMSPFSHPVLWLTIVVAGIPIGYRRFRRGVFPFTLVVSCAGIGNFLLYAALGPADNLRYLFPTMFCALVLVVEELRRLSVRTQAPETDNGQPA